MIACPDCGQPWDLELELACPSCQLSLEDLETAGAYLADLTDTKRLREEGAPAVETDESPTTRREHNPNARTTLE